MQEANFLTKYGTKVYIIHRRDTLRASKVMQARAKANPKIEFIWNSEVAEAYGNERGLLGGLKVGAQIGQAASVLGVSTYACRLAPRLPLARLAVSACAFDCRAGVRDARVDAWDLAVPWAASSLQHASCTPAAKDWP